MPNPPKPIALRVVENGGKMRGRYVERAKREPHGKPGLPPAPKHLNAEQRAIWERLAEDAPAGLLEHADADLFEGYCVLVQMRNQAARDMNEVTNAQILTTSTVKSSVQIVNPYLKEYRRLTMLLRTLQNDLGFNPIARTRIAIKIASEEDPLDQYLGGSGKK